MGAYTGTVVGRGTLPTRPEAFARLCHQYQLPPGTPVALETGTSAFYVARALSALDLKPVVIDAHEVRVKARRPAQKSDRRDAFELCDGLRRDPLSLGRSHSESSHRRHPLLSPDTKPAHKEYRV